MAELDLNAERIDSRDLLERLEELAGFKKDLEDAREELEARLRVAVDRARELFGPDEEAELATLEEVDTEGEKIIADWYHGETLIREDKFQEYAKELAEDIGAGVVEGAWPHNCIDWEKAARELRMDYAEIEIDGTTYLGHA